MMDRFSTRRTQQKMERMRHSAVSFSRDVGFVFFLLSTRGFRSDSDIMKSQV